MRPVCDAVESVAVTCMDALPTCGVAATVLVLTGIIVVLSRSALTCSTAWVLEFCDGCVQVEILKLIPLRPAPWQHCTHVF